jgi:hypothetical protein
LFQKIKKNLNRVEIFKDIMLLDNVKKLTAVFPQPDGPISIQVLLSPRATVLFNNSYNSLRKRKTQNFSVNKRVLIVLILASPSQFLIGTFRVSI